MTLVIIPNSFLIPIVSLLCSSTIFIPFIRCIDNPKCIIFIMHSIKTILINSLIVLRWRLLKFHCLQYSIHIFFLTSCFIHLLSNSKIIIIIIIWYNISFLELDSLLCWGLSASLYGRLLNSFYGVNRSWINMGGRKENGLLSLVALMGLDLGFVRCLAKWVGMYV